MKLSGAGLSVDLPAGWEAEISGPEGEARPHQGAHRRAVVHAANFPLPPDRGDFGSGAVELMSRGDALVVLFEHDPSLADAALFDREGPGEVRATDFAPQQMQRPLPGQSGMQRFFRAHGRAFCLYVALGSHVERALVLDAVNEVVGGISFG